MEVRFEEFPVEPSAGRRAAVLGAIGGIAALVVLIALALRAANDVGGFCAAGGPYVIRQGCPVGVLPVMAVGVPLLVILIVTYMVALPKTWKSMVLPVWLVLFVGLGAVFVYSALTADDSFQIAPFLVGLMMGAIGLVPLLLPKAARPGFGIYPDREDGGPPQYAAMLVGLAIGALIWFTVLA